MVNSEFEFTDNAPLSIAIIGLGSRGLAVLERILTMAPYLSGRTLEIVVYEPNQPGVGLHATEQPDYLLLNTIACQLSVFPDHAANGSRDERIGPNFYQWCVVRNIMVDEQTIPCQVGGRPVMPTDFLPRRLIGEYLSWAYETITTVLPVNVTIRFHRQRATRVVPVEGGRTYIVSGESGASERVDRLFLTVGHIGRRQDDAATTQTKLIDDAYPLPGAVEHIPFQAMVGVEGFGLVAMDTLTALTVGRGGRYLRNVDGTASYVRSGREPRIVLYSRSGLPFRVRPDTSHDRTRHAAIFLTSQTIARLRSKRVDGKIDFDVDALPLLLLEMRAAFYLTHVGMGSVRSRSARFGALQGDLAAAFAAGTVEQLFDRLAAQYGAFDPVEHLVLQVPPGLRGCAYAQWVREFIKEDLAAGRSGLFASPLKAALEVWRDLRDLIRSLVDYGGLTSQSQQRFFSVHAALVCRTVAGPQKERHQDLLALIDAGIVTIAPGYEPIVDWHEGTGRFRLTLNGDHSNAFDLDWIIRARVSSSGLVDTESQVLADLYREGLVRPIHGMLGLDCVEIDKGGHPIDKSGRPVGNLWLFGPIVEGATYYNHYIPSAGAYSRALKDAHDAVIACLGPNVVNRPATRCVA